MPTGNTWWTDDKVDETVTSAYVHSHLRANEQDILKRSLYFGGDLTDDTYLDWILSRAKRFFLVLVASGIPDQIFGIIDDSFDDDDLPIAEVAVPGLQLSLEPDPALDKRFYKAQFKYLARVLQDGEHIRYASEETIPVTATGLKSSLSINKDAVDTVRLPTEPSRVFIRRKVPLKTTVNEEHVLSEIAEMKKFSHEHVLSVYGSYLQGDNVYLLSSPAGDWTLRTFLMDQPKSFDALTKTARRQTLINWPHCLASAVAWLHANGGHHGAIRPSNVHVTHDFQICLGSMEGEGVLCNTTKADDIESYHYAPPERWKRAVTVQSTGSAKVSLPSGGRSGRKVQPNPLDPADPSTRRSASTLGSHDRPTGGYTYTQASKSEFSRLRLSNAPGPAKFAVTSVRRERPRLNELDSVDSFGTARGRPAAAMTEVSGDSMRAPSVLSSASSEGRRRANLGSPGLFVAAPESRTAVVQTWKSVQHDSFAADCFSLGAVMLDIITVLCKRTFSSFARHRSKNNRNAGRGGGLADASFHANLNQVVSWAQILSDDAEKKVKKDESRVLAAVGAVLQVIVPCLERVPEARPRSSVLEKRLKDHTIKFAGIDHLHCVYLAPEAEPRAKSQQLRYLDEPVSEPMRPEAQQTRSRRARTPILELDEVSSDDLGVSPRSKPPNARPSTSRTAIRPASPPVVSLDSFSSLNIDPDVNSLRSDTVVARSATSRSGTSRDPSIYTFPADVDMSSYPPDIPKWRSHQAADQWDISVENDPVRHSDQKWPLATKDVGESGGLVNYVTYSTSPSSDDEGQSYQFALPPSQPPPKSGLPPVPARHGMRDHTVTQGAPYSKYHHDPGSMVMRPQMSEDDAMRMLQRQQLSSSLAKRGGAGEPHPVHMSSLTREEKALRQRELERERSRGNLNHDKRSRGNDSGKLQSLSPVARHMAEQERVYRYRI